MQRYEIKIKVKSGTWIIVKEQAKKKRVASQLLSSTLVLALFKVKRLFSG